MSAVAQDPEGFGEFGAVDGAAVGVLDGAGVSVVAVADGAGDDEGASDGCDDGDAPVDGDGAGVVAW